jgi:hypothetical protein
VYLKLYHVQKFEIASNDRGLRGFLTVRGTVATECFYGRTDGDLRWFSPWTVTVGRDLVLIY